MITQAAFYPDNEMVKPGSSVPKRRGAARRVGRPRTRIFPADIPVDEQGRPRLPLKKGEGRNSHVRKILGCTDRLVRYLLASDKITGKRNTAHGRDGQWIFDLDTVREYKAVSEREDDKPRTRGWDVGLSKYLTRNKGEALRRASIYRIDGRETAVGQAWVWYTGTTGKRHLARFLRGGSALENVSFLIEAGGRERGEDDEYHVFIFGAVGVGGRALKAALERIVKNAVSAAEADAQRGEERQQKEREREKRKQRTRKAGKVVSRKR